MADKKPTIKTIIDHIGRTVVGSVVKEDTKTITLFNPVIIHVQPDPQSGQLQVQSFPYIFMEFLKDKDGDPMSLIDLFILLKDRFGGISEKDIKKYSIRLINNNVLDLRRAREKWI